MTPATAVAALLLTGVAVHGWLGWQDRRACAWANITSSEEDEWTTRLLSTSAYGGVEYGNQLIDHFGTITPPSPEQTARARRYVAGMATDVEDAKVLLAMLGLGAS